MSYDDNSIRKSELFISLQFRYKYAFRAYLFLQKLGIVQLESTRLLSKTCDLLVVDLSKSTCRSSANIAGLRTVETETDEAKCGTNEKCIKN